MSAHNNNRFRFRFSVYYISLAIALAFPVAKTLAQEQLFVPINNTWKAVQSENKFFGSADNDVQEFIPNNEEDKTWTKRITLKEMPGKKISSDKYADDIQSEIEKTGQCTKSVTAEPVEKKHPGFEESVITFQCLQKDGSSKIFMSKTMESPSGLYEVRYSFVTDVNGMYSGKTLKNYLWEDVVEFMQLVQLCDNETKDRACPLQ
jgi:hypothetical protein